MYEILKASVNPLIRIRLVDVLAGVINEGDWLAGLYCMQARTVTV